MYIFYTWLCWPEVLFICSINTCTALLSTSPHAGSEDVHRDHHTILVLNSWSLSAGSLCVFCTDFLLPNQTICWISQSCRLFLSTPPHPSFIEIIDIHCCIDFKCMAGWPDFLFLFNQAILSTTGGRYLSPSQGPSTPEHNRSLRQLPRLQSPQEAVGWGWGGQASGARWDLPHRRGLTRTFTEQTEQDPEGKARGRVLAAGLRQTDSGVMQGAAGEGGRWALVWATEFAGGRGALALASLSLGHPKRTHSLVSLGTHLQRVLCQQVWWSQPSVGWEGPGLPRDHLLGVTHSSRDHQWWVSCGLHHSPLPTTPPS